MDAGAVPQDVPSLAQWGRSVLLPPTATLAPRWHRRPLPKQLAPLPARREQPRRVDERIKRSRATLGQRPAPAARASRGILSEGESSLTQCLCLLAPGRATVREQRSL